MSVEARSRKECTSRKIKKGRKVKKYGRYKIIEVWEYRNLGMGIWDTKELDKTGQDTEGMKNEGRKQGRREGK